MSNNGLVGIISDTHDNRGTIEKAVELFNKRGVNRVFHAGDFVAPFTVMDFSKLTCEMIMVFGNNDGERIGLYHSFSKLGTIGVGPLTVEHGGKRF
ncbi:MAG: metallophosphoesterase family protein, partial [Thermodesulfobacteriota bacterium]|nr:metallophosphoesterase family protein [Thermodesulfobacteriota bacterium]